MNTDGDIYYMKSVTVHDSDDGRWLRWMDAVCFPEHEPFEFEDTQWYLLEYDGRYVGYAGWRNINDEVGELCRAGIVPEWRGNGFQRHMIKFRERVMKYSGVLVSICTTYPNNYHSMNNLMACGYQACSKDEWPTVKHDGPVVFFKRKL